ncbi:MAG: SDR family oxidoreductase [Planctomycetes bacterium]|nr:SDR family oxidoreductase [Planctomycetota bacterium]
MKNQSNSSLNSPRTILITGGGTGIGKAVAERFLAAGDRIVINGRRADVLEATCKSLDPSGERMAFVAGDIAKRTTAEALVQKAVDTFGGVDVLVNNAGVFTPLSFEEHGDDDFDRYMDIILRGTFHTSQAALVALKASKGSIVNVGSMWAEKAVALTPSSAYSAAKAGVHALTRNLAIELAPAGVRVNAVAPAVVETPVYESFISKEELPGVMESFHDFHPLGRNGQADDVAAAIEFLASPGAGFITGTILPVDGGVLAS